jgi:2-iminobutanoate/2-iminopropanoate deaminase
MELINTDKAPKAIGPYSQAVKANGFVFTAGQLALDPLTGKLKNSTIEEETLQVLENLKNILQAAGTAFPEAVETVIYITDMKDFPVVNTLYEKAMDGHKPARTTVQVAALPLGAKIEISMKAVC